MSIPRTVTNTFFHRQIVARLPHDSKSSFSRHEKQDYERKAKLAVRMIGWKERHMELAVKVVVAI